MSTSIDWKGGRGFVGEEAALAALVAALCATPRSATGEPVGVLSHHLAMDDGAWDFLRSLWRRAMNDAGLRNPPARRIVRVTGGRALEFCRSALSAPDAVADYVRAAAGVVLCGAPLLLLDVNRWLAVILLAAGFLLFARLPGAHGACATRTRYVLGPDTLCADGPAGTLVEWSRLDRLKLSYYSTKRDRTSGWMQLAVGSAGGRTVKVDSSLDGFHDIVERAAQAAEANGVELSERRAPT